MKLLLNSTCPMIHSSIIIVYIYDIVQYSMAILEELEYLANLRHCASCFGIQNALFLHSEQAS